MQWLDRLTPDVTASAFQDALRAVGIESKLDEGFDAEDDPQLRFDSDDWHYSISFDAVSKRLSARGAWRRLPLEDGLRLVAEALRDDRDVTVSARAETGPDLSWVTATRLLVLTFADDGQPVHLRCDMREASDPPYAVTSESFASQIAKVAEVGRRLASTPAAAGDRGVAVAHWQAHFSRLQSTLARLLELARQTSPDAPVVRGSVEGLAQDVEQLAEHERRFTGDDDWRSALLIVDRENIPYTDPDRWGWRMELAGEGSPEWAVSGPVVRKGRAVVLVEGPFAYGSYRGRSTAHELHAIDDRWPTDEVVTQDLADFAKTTKPAWRDAYDPRWLRQLGACVASLGETRVILTSLNGDVERIATLLACARARAT